MEQERKLKMPVLSPEEVNTIERVWKGVGGNFESYAIRYVNDLIETVRSREGELVRFANVILIQDNWINHRGLGEFNCVHCGVQLFKDDKNRLKHPQEDSHCVVLRAQQIQKGF